MRRVYTISGEQWDAINQAISVAQVLALAKAEEDSKSEVAKSWVTRANAGSRALLGAVVVTERETSSGFARYVGGAA